MPLKGLTYRLFSTLAALLLAWGGIASCSSDSPQPSDETLRTTGQTYVRLQINVANHPDEYASRATQEDYDSEEALARENNVERLSVIFFKDPEGMGINATNASQISVRAFCWDAQPQGNSSTSTGYTTYTTGAQLLPENMEFGSYAVLLVANADLASLDGKSLEQVRNYLCQSEPFVRNEGIDPNRAECCRNFVMASATNAHIIIGTESTHKGTLDDAYTTTDGQPVTLERLAARLDFVPTADAVTDGEGNLLYYDYHVTNNGAATNSHFRLKYVEPFNVTRESYLFKHLSDVNTTTQAPASTTTWLGSEFQSNGSVRYVIDPLTLRKGIASTPSADYQAFYVGDNRYESLPQNGALLRQRYPVRQGIYSNSDDAAHPYYILDYTAENTLSAAVQNSADVMTYATGLRFVGTYVPNGNEADAYERTYDYIIVHRTKLATAQLTQPMALGIVRNCIYRINISAVEMTPDNFQISLHIKVLPWQQYRHSEIIM